MTRGNIGLAMAAVFILSALMSFVPAFGDAKEAWGQEASPPPPDEADALIMNDLNQYDLSQIQDFINSQQNSYGWNLSFKDLMKNLIAGNFKTVMSDVGTALKDNLFSEVGNSGRLMGQIIILGLIGAVFTNFSSVFTSSQISETGFFVTYLLLFTFLATSFFTSISIAARVVGQILGLMTAIVPAFFLAVAFAGGSLSSIASYEFTLLAITVAQWLLSQVMIPAVRVYILLVLAGHVAKEDILSKMTQLISTAIQWGVKTMVGVVLGFHLIQGMVLPYVDSVKSGAVQKLIEVIPVVGQGAGAAARLILGSGVLIKNTMGAAAVVILLILIAIPVLKLTVLMFFYHFMAAVMQPVCDKRIVSCISETAQGHKLLLGIVAAAVMLFVITVGVVCSSSNITYYAG